MEAGRLEILEAIQRCHIQDLDLMLPIVVVEEELGLLDLVAHQTDNLVDLVEVLLQIVVLVALLTQQLILVQQRMVAMVEQEPAQTFLEAVVVVPVDLVVMAVEVLVDLVV